MVVNNMIFFCETKIEMFILIFISGSNNIELKIKNLFKFIFKIYN